MPGCHDGCRYKGGRAEFGLIRCEHPTGPTNALVENCAMFETKEEYGRRIEFEREQKFIREELERIDPEGAAAIKRAFGPKGFPCPKCGHEIRLVVVPLNDLKAMREAGRC